MHWRVKHLAQRVLSSVPGGRVLYQFAQRRVGRLRTLSAKLDLVEVKSLLGDLEGLGETLVDKTTLEIGTGWKAALPIWFWLQGQRSCHTYDLNRWLSAKALRSVLQELSGFAESGAQTNGLLADRVARLNQVVQGRVDLGILEREFGIHYHAPADATQTGLPSDSVDLVFSKYVFGHIPIRVLIDFVHESMRVLRPGGLFAHLVDLKDQYSSDGGGVSPIHFLQYSEQEYRKFDTAFLHQNRLRESQLRSILEKAGLKVVRWKSGVSPAARAALPDLRLAPEFADLPESDLCTTSVRFVARKP